ncbi:hypothetical protein HYDPIDRAFT_168634 [Hydnomerulius pinastri MD-312]|uniref:Unplaced genomic scaffold scaffold_18, whole genome shotgun sequence n=1 Tax=Hydnomerulius pinastri MD-312 TaxID=994086 RepID=A0A0C9WE45_9AGAM|nr:hypothetical protein HYDPIDRAFT_168634 [Hydnomerulius pinastri MD-312]
MRTDHIGRLVGLIALLGSVGGSHASSECRPQAWVRAPDLAPGAIVQGDARLKITGECPLIETASLGLRFKERSFVKASLSGEALKAPVKMTSSMRWTEPENFSPSSPWVLPASQIANYSTSLAYEQAVLNKELWIVREEERIVFESIQALDIGKDESGFPRDVVQDFAILVPFTNFPPALDYADDLNFDTRHGEFVNAESMYEYFVRVGFTNGTVREIPAGFTAFQPVYDSLHNPGGLKSVTFQLETESSLDGSPTESSPMANYTVEISTVSGLSFAQGSNNQAVTVVVHRTGLARNFVEPLGLSVVLAPNLTTKWAAEYTVDPSLQSVQKPKHLLRATSEDFKDTPSRLLLPPKGAIKMQNATSDQIKAKEIVTTSSDAGIITIQVDRRHATNFEAYYQDIANALVVNLDIPRTQDEPLDPDNFLDHRIARKSTPHFEDDEDEWVPWYTSPDVVRTRGVRTYTGRAAATVVPAGQPVLPKTCLRAGVSEQLDIMSEESSCSPSPIHYLSEGARSPVFVDPSTALELLDKAPAERDALAPLLDPRVNSPNGGEELVHRYFRTADKKTLIYVGETWVKKVTHKEEHRVVARPDSMATAMDKLTDVMQHMFDEL